MISTPADAPSRLLNALPWPLKVALGAFTAVVLASTAQPAHAVTYTFQDIIDPANPTFTQALGINAAGTIVGYGNATDFNGFQLVLPPVVANFTRENFPNPPPPGATFFTQVVGIDAAGDTVGFYVVNPAVGTTNGFLKPFGGAFTTVNQPGSVFNQLLGINQNGNEIAGYSSFTDVAGMTGQKAFSLSGTTYTDINGLLPANFNSQATGVNNSGEVVGFYQLASGNFSAFTDLGGSITSFQAPGAISTQALGVNDLGQIVGDFVDNMDVMHGFLDSGGMFTTLDPTASTATTINGINDLGTVVGFYLNAAGSTIGTVGTPVTATPEPGSLVLLATGLFGIGVALRRRKGA
jgi:hypothetical protein